MEFFIFVFVALILVGLIMLAREWFISKREKKSGEPNTQEDTVSEMQEDIKGCCKKELKTASDFKYLSPKKMIIFLAVAIIVCVGMYFIHPSLGNRVDVPHDKTTQIIEIQNEENFVYFKLANGHVLSLPLAKSTDAIDGEDGKSITIKIGDKVTEYDSDSFIDETDNGEFSN